MKKISYLVIIEFDNLSTQPATKTRKYSNIEEADKIAKINNGKLYEINERTNNQKLINDYSKD